MIADMMISGMKTKKILKSYQGTGMELEACDDRDGITGSMFFKNFGGRERCLRFMIRLMRDPQNKVVGAIESIEDVTERRNMAESLENRMREFQVLYQVNAHMRMVTPLNKVFRDVTKDVTLACDEIEPARARHLFLTIRLFQIYGNLKILWLVLKSPLPFLEKNEVVYS